MDRNLLDTNVVAQIGVVVKDIEKTSQAIADFFGMDKPEIIMTPSREKAKTVFRGKPTEARAKLAFFQLGNLQLELIEPDREPSTWKEFLDERGEGVHHLAFRITGMKEKIERLNKNGIPLIQSGEYPGGRYAYLDAGDVLRMIIELVEND
ncbi:VOC family protein [Caldibacillus debilis]|uniref:VOC family protein n=1 Tax=Caldibacillus debilis TaxID=301148 RepID=UPI00036BAD2F|nr:VOC family protein [Caldibacillus debilis]